MSEDLTLLLAETIFIPQSVRELATTELPVSIRLWNVLQRLGHKKLGDLHGESYKEIYLAKNCGRGTILELKDFIAKLLSEKDSQEFADFIEAKNAAETKKRQAETVYIPQEVRGLPLAAFPLPTRLANALVELNFRLVGDLHGFPVNNLKTLRNCGSHTVSELNGFVGKLQQGDFKIDSSAPQIAFAPQELDLAQTVEFIDRYTNELSPRDRDVLHLRFGAAGEKPWTLEEVGGKYLVTRERIRQIQSHSLKLLKNRLGQAGEKLFEQTTRDCCAIVCPLTPQLLAYWTKKEVSDFQCAPSFYVRLLSELAPEIPTLAKGQIIQGQPRNERSSEIYQAIRRILNRRFDAVSLFEMFETLKSFVNGLNEIEFLRALQSGYSIVLTFDAPDKPAIKLTAKRRAAQIANQILSESDRPLTPEEIIERAKEKFGAAAVTGSARSLNNLLYYVEDFYLLDSRAIGLRKHFRLPPEKWNELRDDFFKLLKENNRSFSTSEIISRKLFSWAEIANSSETAAILREDERFTDLGRFHFALAEWDVAEREMVTDLIVRVLKKANHPLTSTAIGDGIQNFRSITPTSMSSILRQHEAVKDYGFGFYGLKEWKDEYKQLLVSNREYVNRAVSRSAPPLTFGDLCRKLEIAETETLADKLWRTLRALPKLKFKPNIQSPETFLIHTNWRFERAIQKILAQAARPLSPYEIQWESSRIFGKTFEEKTLDAIKNCLQNTDLFVRNPQGAYLLDEQLDESDLDAESLREACFEILKEENAPLSTDDLLEKLAAEDLTSDKLSAEMLAVILRGDALFEEIGMNLFRVKK
jgi:hypothetical protein